MKKTKLIRGAIMAVFVLLALLLVYTVVKQTMPDIIPLLQSGDEEALEVYLERDMSFTGILCMALLQMVQVWSIVISGVIVNVAAGVVYGVWRAFAICLISSSLAHGISFTVCQHLGKYLDKILPDTGSYKLDLIAKSEHPAYTVVTLCFLPILPERHHLHRGQPLAAEAVGIYARHVLRQRVQRIRLLLARQQSCAGRLDRLGGAGRVHAGRGILMWRYQKQILHFTDRLMEKRKKHHGKQHTDISES